MTLEKEEPLSINSPQVVCCQTRHLCNSVFKQDEKSGCLFTVDSWVSSQDWGTEGEGGTGTASLRTLGGGRPGALERPCPVPSVHHHPPAFLPAFYFGPNKHAFLILRNKSPLSSVKAFTPPSLQGQVP